MIYSLLNLSLILASGLGKPRQDQARRAVHVYQGQANPTLTRPRSPTIGRCPSDSGFLAGRVRVGPGSAGRAAKSNENYQVLKTACLSGGICFILPDLAQVFANYITT